MKATSFFGTFVCVVLLIIQAAGGASPLQLDADSDVVLHTPAMTDGPPAAGRRVRVTPPEFEGSEVFHTLYLPADWKADGPKLPIIFELTGNYFPKAGSTGEPEGAGLGYGLTGGKFIWVSLPYISEDHRDNAVTWWGDTAATVAYAKRNVPRIIDQFNADPNVVLLCGFSRGAIGANFIGMHDDEIAGLWDALVSHDHFDGVKRWGTAWGSPLEKYRDEALVRLRRVGDRPYLVCQNGSVKQNADYIRAALSNAENFRFNEVNTTAALGSFPNEFAVHPHNDRWCNVPSKYREQTWQWINQVVRERTSAVDLGQLIFADTFARSESQELKDEPGNAWTTSSGKTAGGNKQVDLRDGTMHIYTHATANHATSVRHTFQFRDGSLALRFRLPSDADSLKLNFTDLSCKSVHAGHLFNVIANAGKITIQDLKTGIMRLTIRKARSGGTLSADQKNALLSKSRSFPAKLAAGQWHNLFAHIDGETVRVELDGKLVGSFDSEGFAHAKKAMIRLLVPGEATVDDLRVWRRASSSLHPLD